MSAKVLVFQHVPHEHLGELAPAFKSVGVEYDYIHPYQDELWDVDWEHLGNPDGLVIMGGPQSVNDDIAFLRHELRLIESALRLEKPLLGICLGAQLIAKALGAKVYRGRMKEIGWYDLHLSPAAREDLLLEAWPASLKMFQWHGETFDLPRNAQVLAASEAYDHQAFRYGDRVYGLQFHPEMNLEMIEEWLAVGAKELAESSLPRGPTEILTDSKEFLPALSDPIQSLAKSWASLLG